MGGNCGLHDFPDGAIKSLNFFWIFLRKTVNAFRSSIYGKYFIPCFKGSALKKCGLKNVDFFHSYVLLQ